ALSHVLAKRGCSLILAGRNETELNKIADDLHIRYRTDVCVELFDAIDFSGHAAFADRCVKLFDDGLIGVVLCYGIMVDQKKAEVDFSEARRVIDMNFASAVSVLNTFANYFEAHRRGYIAAISSVAGDRGRQSNYIYGATKAALSAYLQ